MPDATTRTEPAPFDQLPTELQDAFLETIAIAVLETALDELDRQDAAAAAAAAPDTDRKAG